MGFQDKNTEMVLPFPAHSVPPTLQQATTDQHLHWRHLDTHGKSGSVLLWGHCSILLGPDAHKVLFVSSKSLFPQSCVSSGGSIMGLTVTSSRRAYAIPRSAAPRLLPLGQATADPYLHRDSQILKGRSGSASVGTPGCTRFCLSPPSISGGYGI